jgi:hypothetical protein
MGDFAGLPISFWLEMSLALPMGFAVYLLARTIRRAQERHQYRAWRGTAWRSVRESARR